MNKVLAVATAGLIVLAPREVPAATWYVDGTLAQSGNGKSWDTAFKTIQEGIDASSHGDTVIAARAIYFEKIAFKGKNIVLRSLDPLDPDVVASTIIAGTPAPGSVVTFSGTENDKCVLAGFAIRGGDAISGGGGINGGTGPARTRATIRNNIIADNRADYGGGLYRCDGVIRDNTIIENEAVVSGGGLCGCGGTIRDNLSSRTRRDYMAGDCISATGRS